MPVVVSENLETASKVISESFLIKLSVAVDELYTRCSTNSSKLECGQVVKLLETSIERFEKLKQNIQTFRKDNVTDSGSLRILVNFNQKLTTRMRKEDRLSPSDSETVIGSTPSVPSDLSDANVTNSVIGDEVVAMFSPTNMSHSATCEGSKSWADYDSEGEIDFSTDARSHTNKKSTGRSDRNGSGMKKPQMRTKPIAPTQVYPGIATTPFGQFQVVQNYPYYSAPNLYYAAPNQYQSAVSPYQVIYPCLPRNPGATHACVSNNVYSTHPSQLPCPSVLNVYPPTNGLSVQPNAHPVPNILTQARCFGENVAGKDVQSNNDKDQ